MQKNEIEKLREANWRRRLTAAEQAALREFLAADSGAAEEWRLEESLSRALERLPAAPVSSNFTARVVAAAQRGAAAPARASGLSWFFRGWWPRLAAGVAMAAVGFVSFQEYQSAHRVRAARELAAASRVAALPPMEWLNNFDTIQHLDQVKVADDELLSVLE